MENTNAETNVEVKEIKKEEVDLITTKINPIKKVFTDQSNRVIRDFNLHCERSMRTPGIVEVMVAIESYKLLKEIRDLLVDNKEKKIQVVMPSAESIKESIKEKKVEKEKERKKI